MTVKIGSRTLGIDQDAFDAHQRALELNDRIERDHGFLEKLLANPKGVLNSEGLQDPWAEIYATEIGIPGTVASCCCSGSCGGTCGKTC